MRLILVGLSALGLAMSASGLAQTRPPRPPDVLTIDSLAGKDTFDAYCAPCHGRSGAGDGPVAPVLRTPPADLRTLASRRGFYPKEEIVAFVTGSGRPIAAHGSSDMPIWGAIFRGLDPSDARVKIRLQNVVDYLESLQR
jgi:mono/diheme cytochrome c family protein